MATSSITKDFVIRSESAKRRFEAYEAEKGITIQPPKDDPLKKGRELLAQGFLSSKK